MMASHLQLKERLPNLTEQIVRSYSKVASMNHLGHCQLPRYDVILAVIEDLKDVIFPGYRRRENLHLANITYHVGDVVDRIHDKLSAQIARALMHEDRVTNDSREDPCQDEYAYQVRGQEVAIDFLERLPAIRDVLATDVQAAYDGDPACRNLDEVIFCYPGLEAVTVFRLAHELQRLEVPFIPRMMSEWAHQQTGIDIHPGATVGRHFFIDHGTGVVIGETCEIGDHVKLYQGVTLGALSFDTDTDGKLVRGRKRHPTIEDHVVIYANATVLGGQTTIGHHSVIGSSVWLTRSIDPNTTVLLEKPKLRMRSERSETLGAELNYQI